MAYEEVKVAITLLAAADFRTTGQFRFGTVNSDGKVGLTGNGLRADGVVLNNPDADQAIEFGISGVLMVEAGGSITAGAEVQSGANGVVVAGTTYVVGVALTDGESGEVIPVLFRPTRG